MCRNHVLCSSLSGHHIAREVVETVGPKIFVHPLKAHKMEIGCSFNEDSFCKKQKLICTPLGKVSTSYPHRFVSYVQAIHHLQMGRPTVVFLDEGVAE